MEYKECFECKHNSTIAEYGERIKTLEEKINKNSLDHKEFYGKFEEIHIENKETQINVNQIMKTINEIAIDVKDIKERPARRYSDIIKTIITVIVSGIIGMLLNNTFML